MVLVYFLKAQLLKCKAFRHGFMLFFCFLPPPSPLNTEATYTKGDATSVCYKSNYDFMSEYIGDC